jgi:DNA-binding response OmpR family regulator
MMKILLVDDEKELVSTLAERLSFRGIRAKWAINVSDALSIAEKDRFDVAVIDVKMPKMGGFELKRKLEEKFPDMKFIFVTGHGSQEAFEQAEAEGSADYYLVKPISIEVLIQKIHEVLKQ